MLSRRNSIKFQPLFNCFPTAFLNAFRLLSSCFPTAVQLRIAASHARLPRAAYIFSSLTRRPLSISAPPHETSLRLIHPVRHVAFLSVFGTRHSHPTGTALSLMTVHVTYRKLPHTHGAACAQQVLATWYAAYPSHPGLVAPSVTPGTPHTTLRPPSPPPPHTHTHIRTHAHMPGPRSCPP